MNRNGYTNAKARRERFVAEYIISQNATKAAQLAGYSEHSAYSQGQRLLKNAEIAQKIKEAEQKRLNRLELTADYVLIGIQETIERCRQNEPVLDSEGKETGEYKFNSRDALKGYELLGKHLKLFTDRVEHSGEVATTGDTEIAAKLHEYAERFGLTYDEAKQRIVEHLTNPAAIAALDAAFPALASETKQ